VDVEMTPDVLQDPPSAELLDGGDGVDRLPAGVDRAEGLEDLPVRGPVEVLGPDQLDDIGDRFRRQHHRAEHRLLGLEVVGRHPVRPDPPDLLRRAHHRPLPSSPPATER
jgi:hypothetical protein